MLEIKDVSKSYGKKVALDGIDLTVENSSVCGLVGYNGAGKTTLLKIIASVYTASSGQVLLNGKDTAQCVHSRREMYFIPDDLWFPAGSTLNSMAEFCRSFYENFSAETYEKLVGMMGLDPKARLSSFSKGMKRQAAFIMALSSRPSLLLIDESFDGLDPLKRDLVKKLLMEYIAETEGSVLISSHNLRELSDVCDCIALMNGNKIQINLSNEEITKDRYKIRLVFDREIENSELSALGVKGIAYDGKIIIGYAEDDGEIFSRIEGLSPVLFERFPMTLEEVLLNEMGGNDYDFKDLF